MNDTIDNAHNPEPKFFLHQEMIYWLQQNMQVSLNINKERVQDLYLPDGSIISADTEFANISVSITFNGQDVHKGDFPKRIYSTPIRLLIPKNENAQWGGATEREKRLYDDMNKMATRVNNLLTELEQLRGALKSIQYPLPQELQ